MEKRRTLSREEREAAAYCVSGFTLVSHFFDKYADKFYSLLSPRIEINDGSKKLLREILTKLGGKAAYSVFSINAGGAEYEAENAVKMIRGLVDKYSFKNQRADSDFDSIASICLRTATGIIEENKRCLTLLVNELIEKEMADSEDIERILSQLKTE